jgi:HEAT repeat protein
MRERGYVLYRGRWRLSQEVELMEAERRRELAERQWYRQLLRWRRDGMPEHADAAASAILEIRDPLAVPGLVSLLHREELRSAKLLWIRALSNIGSPEALQVLVDVVLQERDREVIHACLELLQEHRSPLVRQRLQETLTDEHNELVNRAGLALGHLGETSAIDSLIDALVTHHRLPLGVSGDKQTPQFVVVPVKNLGVLSALTDLAATAGYGFDERAWKQWRYLQNQQLHAEELSSAEVRRGR